MDRTETNTPHRHSSSEQLEVNARLFIVVRKSNISTREKVKKIKKLLGKNSQLDTNAQDVNDNWNTALHLAIERNELEVVNFLLVKEQTLQLKLVMGKRLYSWLKNVIM